MAARLSTLAGWGRLAVPGRERRSEDLGAVARDAVLCRGLGRSYGDSALPPAGCEEVAGSILADRILSFDPERAVLRAEAGLSLLELNRLLLPRRWFLPVSPGTQFVTLGGMVAADVHGKNHHRAGTIGRHVRALRMLLPDGRVVEASRESHDDLFRATLGGMGLTGHLLEVELDVERIPSPWILASIRRCRTVAELTSGLQEAGAEWPFTAAWLDAVNGGRRFGRGVLICGRWAEAGEAPKSQPPPVRRLRVPLDAPGWLLNRGSVGLFNLLYYHRQPARERRRIVHPDSFFYPLDAVLDWNRLYGRRGMTQYQCVLPAEVGVVAVEELLARMRALGGRSYLVVLKDFGEEGEGVLSFPRPGFTLALDFPVGPGTQALVDGLNREVRAHGGRIYLAKDAFSRPDDFQAMEARLGEWQRIRQRWGVEQGLRSRQSERLMEQVQ